MFDQTIRLGDEYDDALIGAAQAALRASGATRSRNDWGVAGSQEVAEEDWTTGDGVVTLRAETYAGLTLTGPTLLIQQLAVLIRERLA